MLLRNITREWHFKSRVRGGLTEKEHLREDIKELMERAI